MEPKLTKGDITYKSELTPHLLYIEIKGAKNLLEKI
jgi:hypothetical protein